MCVMRNDRCRGYAGDEKAPRDDEGVSAGMRALTSIMLKVAGAASEESSALFTGAEDANGV